MKATRLLAAAIAVLLFASGWAGASCTTVTATTVTTKILAAVTSSTPRRVVDLTNNGPASWAYCDVGNSSGATALAGYPIAPGQTISIRGAQFPANTFPQGPNGEVDCVTATGTAAVSACVY